TDPTVIVLATTTSLATSPNPSSLGQPVTLTATVSAGATGTVEFADGMVPFGRVALSGNQAVLTTSRLASGPRSLTATYIGDTTHAPSTSAARVQTVNGGQSSGLAAATAYATGAGPDPIAAADFNGDGALDL